MPFARRAVAAAIFVGLTGCAAASADRSAASLATAVPLDTIVPTQPPAVTTTPAAASSTTVVTTTIQATAQAAPITSVVQRCTGSPTLRTDATFGMVMTTDLDGDSVPDRFITYGLPGADGLLQWQARAELANGEPSEIALPDASGTEVRPLGALELDALDSHLAGDEAVVQLDSDPEVATYGFAGIGEDGCLFRFGDGAGEPVTVTIEERDRVRHGLRCDLVEGAQQLVALDAASTDGQSFETRDRVLQRVTTNLVPAPPLVARATLDGPALFAYGIVQCPGIGVE